ncbi:MAG: type II toxin-antitoxin system RelE/ParE family toxin [Xanthobacteraceae bacterium]|nr:type II toxin-antitoxin system RelE/ParE family toxin [Xanthobacteraceae bacterium]
MRTLVFRPETRTDIADAARWYEGQAEGLGADFLRAVDVAIASIQHNPHQYQQVYRRVRRTRLRRFPYVVIYYVAGDEIVVVGCFHGHSDPERWQSRLP